MMKNKNQLLKTSKLRNYPIILKETTCKYNSPCDLKTCSSLSHLHCKSEGNLHIFIRSKVGHIISCFCFLQCLQNGESSATKNVEKQLTNKHHNIKHLNYFKSINKLDSSPSRTKILKNLDPVIHLWFVVGLMMKSLTFCF